MIFLASWTLIWKPFYRTANLPRAIYNPSNISTCKKLVKAHHLHMTGHSPSKTEEYVSDIPLFIICTKYLMDNKHIITPIWLKKYAPLSLYIDQNLFLEAHNFPPVSLLENCSLLGTDNVCSQIPEPIFAPKPGYYLHVYINSRATSEFKQSNKNRTTTKKNCMYNIFGVIIQFSYYLLHGVKGVLKSGGFHPTLAMKHHSPANRNTKIVTNRRIGKRTMKPTKICQNKTYSFML